MRGKRTRFASPFVVTVACGARHEVEAPVTPPPPTATAVMIGDVGVAIAAGVVDFAVGAEKPSGPRIVFDDPRCKLADAGEDDGKSVECSDDVLPVAPAGELVVSPRAAECYRVYKREFRGRTSRTAWDEGRVRCPPNVELPSKLVVTIDRHRVQLDEESLTCFEEVLGNPPSWRPITQCPPPLAPKLVGLEPDAPCSYHGVHVYCDAEANAKVIATKARVLAVYATTDKLLVRVVWQDGMGGATRFRLGKRIGTVVRCDHRTCEVAFEGASLEDVRAVRELEIAR